MVHSGNEKRALWGFVYRNTAGTITGATFLARLQSLSDQAALATKGGQFISGTGANGHSVTFSAPGESGRTPGDQVALWQEFIDLHAEASAELVSEGVATPTDAQIHDRGREMLVPVREITADFTGLRCA